MSLQLVHEALYIPVELGRFDVPQSKYQLSLLLRGIAPLMVAKVCYFHSWTAGDIALFKLLYYGNFHFCRIISLLRISFPRLSTLSNRVLPRSKVSQIASSLVRPSTMCKESNSSAPPSSCGSSAVGL